MTTVLIEMESYLVGPPKKIGSCLNHLSTEQEGDYLVIELVHLLFDVVEKVI